MHKTTIYMPDELRRALDAAARETGQSQADLIRRAVHAYLDERPQQLPASIGRHRGGALRARDDEARLEAGWSARAGRRLHVIVLDTSAILALLDADDSDHGRCVEALSARKPPFVVPAGIVGEIGYLVEAKLGPRR